MLKNIFSFPIWQTSIKINNEEKNNLLFQIEDNFKRYKDYKVERWDCDVHSSVDKFNSIDYSPINPYFHEEYVKFTSEYGLNVHDYEMRSWYNYYLKGYYQESHCHSVKDCAFSAIFYLKIPKERELLYFENMTGLDTYFTCENKIQEIYDNTNIAHSISTRFWYIGSMEENSMIIFPSYLNHGVKIKKTEEPRITISTNFFIV